MIRISNLPAWGRRALITGVAAILPVSAAADNRTFQHVATFDVMAGNGSGVAEIVDATPDGKQLVYTDSDNEQIGFVDIRKPHSPQAEGVLDVGGEPTSLVVAGKWILVAVNTSESFVAPSGNLVVVNRHNRDIVASLPLPGQPDSIALAPDGKRVAVILENERDEDLDGGLLPQMPSGELIIVTLKGHPSNWTTDFADLSPVAASAFEGGDLEPEFVDINSENQAVITFQENNHLAIVDMVTGTVSAEFSAGSAKLSNVDTVEEDLIILDSNIEKRREPDATAWIDSTHFVTANEGDYEDAAGEEGGSRGFTIFKTDGSVAYESAESFEHLLVSAGHYNEGRSENKGVEPEAVETGVYGKRNLMFVGSERSNAVGVYDVSTGAPSLVQVLPTGMGPEGLKAVPGRNLLVVSTESDEAGDGIPTMINLFKLKSKAPAYPMIVSEGDSAGLPIPWVALSGLAVDPVDPYKLYAVSDSFLAEGFVYTIDASSTPARITDRVQVNGASSSVDLEGIAVSADGYGWLASEGRQGTRPNAVLKVDMTSGAVLQEILLPAELEALGRNNGFEGVAVVGGSGEEQVYVAIQRAWPDSGDTDGVETKIGRYDVASGTWTFVYYPLQPEANGGWVGLSELTPLPNGQFAVIERDKGWGESTAPNAELKAVYKVDLSNADFRSLDDSAGLITIDKALLVDLLPALRSRSIWTTEKVEGLAVNQAGKMFVVTDNDGVDDAPGETLFFSLTRK